MQIDGQNITPQLIDTLRDVRFHYDATRDRQESLRAGGTAPTLASEEKIRIFNFGPNQDTAAFLTTLSGSTLSQLPWAEMNHSMRMLSELPTLPKLAKYRIELQELPKHRGLRRWFRAKPTAEIELWSTLTSIEPATIHTILSGVDATLGSNGRGHFGNLNLEQNKPAIEAELQRLTNHQVRWIDDALLVRHRAGVRKIAAATTAQKTLEQKVEKEAENLRRKQAQAELNSTDIQVLDQITETRLRLSALRHLTIPQIAASKIHQLTRYSGVGEVTARQAIAAARSYSADVENSQVPVINYQDKEPSTDYVRELANLLTLRDRMRNMPTRPLIEIGLLPGEQPMPQKLLTPRDLLQPGQAADSTDPVRPDEHLVAVTAPDNEPVLLTDEEHAAIPSEADLRPNLSDEDAWHLYAIRAAEFHAFADTSSGTTVPEDIARSIEDITLGGTLHANLRGYQAFGAKFALAQRKVLIGDEMGLGKTMQALAVFAHLAARGKKHFVVVCPPSLRINWQREIEKFTDLTAHVVFGPHKAATYEEFRNEGGVAIVGFPEVRGTSTVMAGDTDISALVVDEAHRAKNPEALQAQGVQRLTDRSPIVIYLTGTPLENKVAEMEALLGYLDGAMKEKLEAARRTAKGFRAAIARLYLRRNQADVLSELPPLLESEEWIEPTADDRERYDEAVLDAHFMNMRQAFSGRHSEKMNRFQELLTDGLDHNKTIVFTYFRSVLDDLAEVLGDRAFGPIAGGVSHADRQQAVDDFTAAPPGAVLIAQINAASEGLNIQAANHVVLFEPQLNPAVEAQAVARAHRMGQINAVEVHRLLTPDSVEERLHHLLASKRELFNSYARDSVTAHTNPEAMDVTSQELIKEVLEAERARVKETRGETPRL